MTAAFKYNYAIVSRIPDSFKENSSRRKDSRSIDLVKARRQHDLLVETLRKLGVNVLELPADEKYPDCVFVDDCAVVINGTALICRPSDNARAGEVAIVRTTLKRDLHCKIVEIDKEGATIDGGDVLWTGKEIFVGLSKRTNEGGALCVARTFPEYPTTMIRLPKDKLHLKSFIGIGGPDILLCSISDGAKAVLKQISELATHRYQLVTLDEREDHAAAGLFINGVLLHQPCEEIPKSYPMLDAKFDNRAETSISELMKADGTLNSLCILVSKVKHPKNFPTTL